MRFYGDNLDYLDGYRNAPDLEFREWCGRNLAAYYIEEGGHRILCWCIGGLISLPLLAGLSDMILASAPQHWSTLFVLLLWGAAFGALGGAPSFIVWCKYGDQYKAYQKAWADRRERQEAEAATRARDVSPRPAPFDRRLAP